MNRHDSEFLSRPAAWDRPPSVPGPPPATPLPRRPTATPEVRRFAATPEVRRFAATSAAPACCFAVLISLLMLTACSRERIQPDGEAPAPVTDLSALSVTADSVSLRWTAPGDDGVLGQAAGYEIRFDTTRLREEGWESQGTVLATPPARVTGTAESLSVGGLPSGRGYIALRTRDEVPNWSAISNVVQVDIPVRDTIPPADITSLGTTGFPRATSVTLTWIAPGDDGETGRADHYEVRQDSERFTEANWDTSGVLLGEPAAGEPGGIETLRIDGLTPQTVYYFAVRTYDEAGNRSGISNQPPIQTAPLDAIPPDAVADLAARLDGLYQIVLTWTASADDGSTGAPAFAYDLRSAGSIEDLEDWNNATQIAAPEPGTPGSEESVRVEGLPARTRFAFALEVIDDSGNRSLRSNLVTISTSDSICVVRPDGNGDYATIGDALASGGGCEIVLESGFYSGEGHANWPPSATRRIRSATGVADECVVDFGGAELAFPPALTLSGITLRNASRILLQADDVATGFVLEAEDCAFDAVSFDSEQAVESGPLARFTDCEFRNGIRSPLLNLGEIEAVRSRFHRNDARIAIAYRSEWIDCTFEENSAPSGSLLRSYNDLQGPNRFLFRGCRFAENENPILSPQNGLLEIEDCLFTRNTESCVFLVGSSTVRIDGGTFVRNERRVGSCIRSDDRNPTIEIDRSIFVGNTGGPLLDIAFDYTLSVQCTDIFGNTPGDWLGPLAPFENEPGNLALDPLFCSWPGDDYTLRSDSPCAAAQQPECGRIGALDVRCEP